MKKIILKAKLKSRDEFEDKLNDIDMEFGAIYHPLTQGAPCVRRNS